MRIPGRKLARRALRPIVVRLRPGAVVLGYHRIASADWDPLGLAVHPDRFDEQLSVLASLRQFVSLSELVRLRRAGATMTDFAVLTFDDGYDDFASSVLPIIESRDVPATLFIATGYVGQPFWWDVIAALLGETAATSSPLRIEFGGGHNTDYGRLKDRNLRTAAVRDICERLACSARSDIESVVAQIRDWCSVTTVPHPGFGGMARERLTELARHPLVELGAHTVSHGCLADLSTDKQHTEIIGSRRELTSMVGRAPRVFSYPNGSFGNETPRLVEKAGFDCACASRDGVFGATTNAFLVPRIWAPDVDGGEFRRWLSAWVPDV